jgi:hypothetical protein
LITELQQQIYYGILIVFNLLTLVTLCFSARRIKLVLQIDIHATRIGGQQLPNSFAGSHRLTRGLYLKAVLMQFVKLA